MKLIQELLENMNDCTCVECNDYEEVYVDENGEVLSEGAIRQFKRIGTKLIRKFRCQAGPKAGKLVSKPGDCAKRKDRAKVRHGKKVMRTKKGVIGRKSLISKRKSMSKLVAKMNKRLSGN